MFYGSITALITPFQNGKLNENAFQNIITRQIQNGTHSLLPCGTTGESPTLSHQEHLRLISLCIEAANKTPVIAGTGSNSTTEALAFTQYAQKAGAAAALIVTPYYNKPTQEGLYQHFKTIHDATNIPIIIYNIPGRSVIDMSVETMTRLAQLKNIIGVKDATADMARLSLQRQAMGEHFCQLSGEDSSALGFMAHGGQGCISVTANVAPALCAAFQNACREGDFAAARNLHDRLTPLHHALFLESSPAPVKYAASLMGLCGEEVRLPLVPPKEETRRQIREALRHAGLNFTDG